MTRYTLAARFERYADTLRASIKSGWEIRTCLRQSAVELRAGAVSELPPAAHEHLAERLEGYARRWPLEAIPAVLQREARLLRVSSPGG